MFHFFGGQSEIYKNKGAQGEIVSNNINYERSAYILVYIQKNRNNKFVSENNLDIIPNYLKKRFESEKQDTTLDIFAKKEDTVSVDLILSNEKAPQSKNIKISYKGSPDEMENKIINYLFILVHV